MPYRFCPAFADLIRVAGDAKESSGLVRPASIPGRSRGIGAFLAHAMAKDGINGENVRCGAAVRMPPE
jgi:hypothetical protein